MRIVRKRFFLNFNPTAGRTRLRAVDELVAHLVAAGADVVRCPGGDRDAARRAVADAARSGNFDAVIAAGGDGTIRQAAAAVAGTECALGAVMLGTGNVLAHELGLPRAMADCAELLRTGPATPVSMGRVNGEPFLLMASAGFDGRAIAALNIGLKRGVGRAAFGPAALKAFAAPLDRLDVTLDGRHYSATWAIVTNARRYGGSFTLTERTSLLVGGLEAVLFHAADRRDLLRHLYWLARGRLDSLRGEHSDDVSMISCTSAEITSVTPVPAQVDGDAFGTTPLRISAEGGQIHLIVLPAAGQSDRT